MRQSSGTGATGIRMPSHPVCTSAALRRALLRATAAVLCCGCCGRSRPAGLARVLSARVRARAGARRQRGSRRGDGFDPCAGAAVASGSGDQEGGEHEPGQQLPLRRHRCGGVGANFERGRYGTGRDDHAVVAGARTFSFAIAPCSPMTSCAGCPRPRLTPGRAHRDRIAPQSGRPGRRGRPLLFNIGAVPAVETVVVPLGR